MTTLRDRPEPQGSGGAGGTAPAGHKNVHCPHCGGLLGAGVDLPWPPEPVLCRSCARWVGRARAVPGTAPEPTPTAETAPVGPDPHSAPLGAPESAPLDDAQQGAAPDHADQTSPHRSPRHRHSRPGPIQRRRARELGPPPVPRFASDEHHFDDRETLEDRQGPATPAPDAWTEAEAAGASDDAPATQAHDATHAHDAWTEPEHAAHGAAEPPLHSGPHGELATDAWSRDNGARGHVADAEPTGVEDAPAHDDDGALAPPAPFLAPGAHPPAPAGNGPVVSPGGVEDAPARIPRPFDDEPGHTLPFWAVEAEPRHRRFLRLLRLRRPTLRRPQFRRPTRADVVRALPIVLLVIGGLLLVEGAVTVLWKEPFSAIMAASSQGALDDELEKLEREATAQASRSRKEAVAYQRRRAVTLNREVGVGEAVGRLRIKKLGLSEVVVQGTDDVTIQKGPGHYMETPLPGQKGDWTVGIAGHRTTYGAPFRRINALERGDEIVFSVPYGRFTYNVDRTKIVDAGYTEAMVPKKDQDQIVLTACHPLYSAAQRILVYGKLTKSEPRGGAKLAARP